MLYLVKGLYDQQLRADVVTQMIKGVKNRGPDQRHDPKQTATPTCHSWYNGQVEGIDPQRKNPHTPQEADMVHGNHLSLRLIPHP